MNSKLRSLASVACSFVLGIPGTAPAQSPDPESPDPEALLRGVYEARAGLSGKLRMTVISTECPNPPAGPKPIRKLNPSMTDAEVEFSGSDYRFIITGTMMLVKRDQEGVVEKINAYGGDLVAAAKAGLGRLDNVRIRTVFGGGQFARFTKPGDAYILNHKAGSPFCTFEMGTLGISRGHSCAVSLVDCLAMEREVTRTLVGREEVAGHPVWHVKVSFPQFKVDYHFWVEDSDGFRVRRYEYCHPEDGTSIRVIAESEYEGDEVLPRRVRADEANDGGVAVRTLFTIHDPDYDYEPDPEVFTLAGLEMPIGEMVIDDRPKTAGAVLGYWNGEGFSKTPEDARQVAGVREAEEADRRRLRDNLINAGVAALAAAALAAAAVWYRRLAGRRGS